MNLSKVFELFNAGRFAVYSCLLLFSVLISLWFDGYITWSIWAVFLPVWIWKVIVLVGAVSGIISWCLNQNDRQDRNTYIQFRAMIISTTVHLILMLFEILVCVRLEGAFIFPWTLVFVPLMFMSLFSILLCLWAIKNERSFEMEMISAVNIVQFVFISIKLDEFINWTWMLVFIPLWVTMVISLIFVVYVVIVAIILTRSVDIRTEHQKVNISTACSYVIIVATLITYEILLVQRLDGYSDYSYTTIGIPLYISLLTLLLMSFSTRPGNIWWFGLKKDLCQFIIMDACPFLREYGNISYKLQFNESNADRSQSTDNSLSIQSQPQPSKRHKTNNTDIPVPTVIIGMPD